MKAGGVVACGHSAGTAYILFGTALLGRAQTQAQIVSMGLYAFAFMGFAGHHTAIETFTIVAALAELDGAYRSKKDPFCTAKGPVFKGVAGDVYTQIAAAVDAHMSDSAAAQLEKLSAAYNAVATPQVVAAYLAANSTVVEAVMNNPVRDFSDGLSDDLPFRAVLVQ